LLLSFFAFSSSGGFLAVFTDFPENFFRSYGFASEFRLLAYLLSFFRLACAFALPAAGYFGFHRFRLHPFDSFHFLWLPCSAFGF
jgi:hypothetical protein